MAKTKLFTDFTEKRFELIFMFFQYYSIAGGWLCTTNFQRTNVPLQHFNFILVFTTYGKEKD